MSPAGCPLSGELAPENCPGASVQWKGPASSRPPFALREALWRQLRRLRFLVLLANSLMAHLWPKRRSEAGGSDSMVESVAKESVAKICHSLSGLVCI